MCASKLFVVIVAYWFSKPSVLIHAVSTLLALVYAAFKILLYRYGDGT